MIEEQQSNNNHWNPIFWNYAFHIRPCSFVLLLVDQQTTCILTDVHTSRPSSYISVLYLFYGGTAALVMQEPRRPQNLRELWGRGP